MASGEPSYQLLDTPEALRSIQAEIREYDAVLIAYVRFASRQKSYERCCYLEFHVANLYLELVIVVEHDRDLLQTYDHKGKNQKVLLVVFRVFFSLTYFGDDVFFA